MMLVWSIGFCRWIMWDLRKFIELFIWSVGERGVKDYVVNEFKCRWFGLGGVEVMNSVKDWICM